jgi:Cu(I)/Ag(I) efflux system membrane fusion protein
VRAVSGDDVFIEHEAIASAGMGAMTMGYKAPPGGVPKDVKPGVRVDFEFVLAPSGQYATTSIVPSRAPAKSQ